MQTILKLSEQQRAVLDWADNDQGSLILLARAGCGKSSTLLALVEHLVAQDPKVSIFVGAYNRAIANEFSSRLQGAGIAWTQAQANTMHGAGLAAWKRVAPEACRNVDGNKLRNIVDLWALNGSPEDAAKLEPYRDAILKAVSMAKQHALGVLGDIDIEDAFQWVQLYEHYGIDGDLPEGADMAYAITQSIRLYKESLEQCYGSIDFDDMILAPLYYKARFWGYNWVMVDECFVKDTPVLMADGTTKAIKAIVDEKLVGPVQSYDTATNTTVIRPITGWHKIPLAKKLVRIVTRRCGYKWDGRRFAPVTEAAKYGHRIVVCTEDSLIWANETWKEAGSLVPGDYVVHESNTPMERHYHDLYKHSPQGLATLSQCMTSKNEDGVCGNTGSGGIITVRGGNGRALTVYQEALLLRLGDPWEAEYTVRTGADRGFGVPTHYKLDLANPESKIGIEIDGGSHQSPDAEERDRKKDEVLQGLGWQVIRVTNQQSITLTEDLINERAFNSPVTACVITVEPFKPRDPYVYDIDVEGTHTFYADGLVVHNCQDTNPARRELAKRLIKPGGRSVWVGDDFQAIYAFTGANADSMEIIQNELNAKVLPLNVTYRCPQVVVKRAQRWVPDFQANGTNPQGNVRSVALEAKSNGKLEGTIWAEQFTASDAILCRNTKPLVELAYRLLRRGVACKVEGREIGMGLIKLVRRWKVTKLEEMLSELGIYQVRETQKWKARGRDEKVAEVVDRCETVQVLAEHLLGEGKHLVSDLETFVSNMFGDTKIDERPRCLTLATVHKAKGREWPRVFILGQDKYMPSPWARKAWQQVQERNLMYVATTRAMQEIIDIVVD